MTRSRRRTIARATFRGQRFVLSERLAAFVERYIQRMLRWGLRIGSRRTVRAHREAVASFKRAERRKRAKKRKGR